MIILQLFQSSNVILMIEKKVTENIVGDRKIVIFVRSLIQDDDFINQKD